MNKQRKMKDEKSKDEYAIPVEVDGEPKLMTGLNKRTTCDDVIYAILQHQIGGSGSDIDYEVANYVICEKWRHLERPLRGRTKLVKAWRAWSSEKHNVKFILHRIGSSLGDDSSVASIDKIGNVRRKRSRRRKERKNRELYDINETDVIRTLKQRSTSETSIKQYGYLDKIKHQKHTEQENNGTAGAQSSHDVLQGTNNNNSDSDRCVSCNTYPEGFNELLALVLHQEKLIQEQKISIEHTDKEIENTEQLLLRQNNLNRPTPETCTKLHDGSQDSGFSTENTDEVLPIMSQNDLDVYLNICEDILHIEDSISKEDDKIENLSLQIFEESCSELHTAADSRENYPRSSMDCHIESEEVHLRAQLEECLTKGMSYTDQIYLTRTNLSQTEEQLQIKNDYVQRILEEIVEVENNNHKIAPVKHVRFVTDKNQRDNYENLPNGIIDTRNKHFNPDTGHKTNRVSEEPYGKSTCRNVPKLNQTATSSGILQNRIRSNNVSLKKNHLLHSVPLKCDSYGSNLHKFEYGKFGSGTTGDSESDTGLSSMHSDDCQQVLETLV